MRGNRFGLVSIHCLWSVLLFCLAGCGGGLEPSSRTDHPSAGLTDLKLFSKGNVGRTIPVDGIDFVAEHGDDNRPGESSANGYIIAPGGNDDLAWAQYVIDGLVIDRPVAIEVEVATVIAPGGNDDLPLSYMIGVFNYTSFEWDWEGPFAETASHELNTKHLTSRYVSADGSFRFQVMTDSSDVHPSPSNPEGLTAVEIVVSTVTVSDEYYFTAPHYTILIGEELIKSGSSARGISKTKPKPKPRGGPGIGVLLTWQHIEDQSNAKNEAKWYKVYRKLADDPGKPILLGKIDAPGTQFRDPEDVKSKSKRMVPGETYIYYLRSKNKSGETAYTATSPIKTDILYPPTELKASDGKYHDKIKLKWKRAYQAEGYEIYRDDQGEPIATVGDIDKWYDTGVGDNAMHTYWLRSIYGDAVSDYSEPDTGYLK